MHYFKVAQVAAALAGLLSIATAAPSPDAAPVAVAGDFKGHDNWDHGKGHDNWDHGKDHDKDHHHKDHDDHHHHDDEKTVRLRFCYDDYHYKHYSKHGKHCEFVFVVVKDDVFEHRGHKYRYHDQNNYSVYNKREAGGYGDYDDHEDKHDDDYKHCEYGYNYHYKRCNKKEEYGYDYDVDQYDDDKHNDYYKREAVAQHHDNGRHDRDQFVFVVICFRDRQHRRFDKHGRVCIRIRVRVHNNHFDYNGHRYTYRNGRVSF